MKDNALYLEVDEDITSAIDKLQKLGASSVQIVVPKRSVLLQSIINLKLLKKASADAGKELVLVTNDRIATDLAARVGLAVAPSLGAEAVMAKATAPAPKLNDDIIEADEPAPPRAAIDAATEAPVAKDAAPRRTLPKVVRRQVGEAAPVAAAAAAEAEAAPGADAEAEAATAASAPRVPNFGKMQKRLLWVGAAVVLIAAYLLAMYFLTSAKVTLSATGTKVDIDTTFAVDPNLQQTDIKNAVLAGQAVTLSKDLTGPVTPTGTKDAGTKAGGTMAIVNNDVVAHDFVAGTRFQAPDGKIFRLDSDAHVDAAQPKASGHGFVTQPSQTSAHVTADQNGDSYNEAPAKYSIPGLTSDQQQYTYGQGAQMSGGTSKTITVLTQSDVDSAKTALLSKDKTTSQKDLDGKVPSGYEGLAASLSQTADDVSSNPGVGQEANAATITMKVTYQELAVKKSEYSDLVKAQEERQLGVNNQIYDDGLGGAQVTASPAEAGGRQSFHLTTQAYGGAKLDTAQIANSIKGKKYGDASDYVTKLPGVQHAEIVLWPAWSTSLPHRVGKINITIQVASDKGE